MKQKEEKRGEIFLLVCLLIQSFFPLFANEGAKLFSPLLYLTYMIGISIPFLLAINLWRGEFKQLFNREVFWQLMGVSLFVIVMPSLLIFWATKDSSGINTTLLTQSEIIYATILCAFLGERISRFRLLGVLFILIGGVLVLYQGAFVLNRADLVLFLAPAFYPLGNVLAKKALKRVGWSTILLFRALIGEAILIALCLSLGESFSIPPREIWFSLLFMGIGVCCVAKIFWYLGLQRMEVGKATAIIMTYPAPALLFAVLFFEEIPTVYQLFGFFVICIGIYFILKSQSWQYKVSA
ncbi:MAG: DMT family transporter [Patescibacteria group bacterium]